MGLGTSSCGLSPFGYGTPTTTTAPPSGPSGTRFIDYRTRDFGIDSETGQLKQSSSLQQRIYIKLMTAMGSSTVQPTFGVTLPDKMGEGFEKQTALAVANAFKQETDVEKIMLIEQIVVEKLSTGRAQITLIYTDLTTGQLDQVRV